jgi:hypothetical protein
MQAAGAILRRARVFGDLKMRFWTKTTKQTKPGAIRVSSGDERFFAARRLQRVQDAAHLDATIARMRREAASPATGKATRRGCA